MSKGYICDPENGCGPEVHNLHCRAPQCDYGIAQAKRKQAFESQLASVQPTPARPSEPEVIKRLQSAVRNYSTWDGKCNLAQPVDTLNEAREVLDHITQLRARCAQLEGENRELKWCKMSYRDVRQRAFDRALDIIRGRLSARAELLERQDAIDADVAFHELIACVNGITDYMRSTELDAARSTPTASEGS